MNNLRSSFVTKSSQLPWRLSGFEIDDVVQESGPVSVEILLKDALDREQALLMEISALKRHRLISDELQDRGENAARTLSTLTKRQKEILSLMLAGNSNKLMAFITGINQRTIESHRAAIMRKAGVRSVTALTRLAIAADLEMAQ